MANRGTKNLKIDVVLLDRDELHLELEIDAEGAIQTAHLNATGCPEVLEAVDRLRPLLTGQIKDLPLPQENTHSAILIRETVLKLRGEWLFPYQEDELCHCRAVPTNIVDAAIIGGARSVARVSRQTSAGTSCGTCRPDIEKILKFRRV